MLARPAPIITANLDRGYTAMQASQGSPPPTTRSTRLHISNPLYSPAMRTTSNQASPLMGHISPFLEHLEPSSPVQQQQQQHQFTFPHNTEARMSPHPYETQSTTASSSSNSDPGRPSQSARRRSCLAEKRAARTLADTSPRRWDRATRQARARTTGSSGSMSSSSSKRLATASPSLKGVDESPSLRTLNHKKSDQRRREALRSSFTRLLAVIPPALQVEAAQAQAAQAQSPPALAAADELDDDDGALDKDGAKMPNRVETMQMTIKYIHSLKEKNEGLDGRIDGLKRELEMLRSAAAAASQR
ncbi:hypothetical protein BDR26DRAFT_1005124 [Obelidium mucronatum]|nr:hypothetical protein BDR26DRAFT_1005124 [Obelidium mucronatum]